MRWLVLIGVLIGASAQANLADICIPVELERRQLVSINSDVFPRGSYQTSCYTMSQYEDDDMTVGEYDPKQRQWRNLFCHYQGQTYCHILNCQLPRNMKNVTDIRNQDGRILIEYQNGETEWCKTE